MRSLERACVVFEGECESVRACERECESVRACVFQGRLTLERNVVDDSIVVVGVLD